MEQGRIAFEWQVGQAGRSAKLFVGGDGAIGDVARHGGRGEPALAIAEDAEGAAAIAAWLCGASIGSLLKMAAVLIAKYWPG